MSIEVGFKGSVTAKRMLPKIILDGRRRFDIQYNPQAQIGGGESMNTKVRLFRGRWVNIKEASPSSPCIRRK